MSTGERCSPGLKLDIRVSARSDDDPELEPETLQNLPEHLVRVKNRGTLNSEKRFFRLTYGLRLSYNTGL